jgi:pimeloyl-ACP methyl ester carboxylesterase
MAKTIVFVHGMFTTPLCWERWLPWFEDKGYRCLAPAWPGRDRPMAELRAAHPDPELGRLTLNAVVERIAAEAAALEQKPILIGHSVGGLITQILLGRDAAAAGIAIHSTLPSSLSDLNVKSLISLELMFLTRKRKINDINMLSVKRTPSPTGC